MPTQTMTLEAIGFQLLGPLSVSLLLFQIYRSFKTKYVLHWTLSFASLAVFHLATTSLIFREGTAEPFVLIAGSVIGGAAAYLQLGWLIWGAAELAKSKEFKVAEPARVLLLLAGVGVLSGAIPFFIGRDLAVHRFFYLGLHALGAALTFIAAAYAVRRFRGAGFMVPAIAFGIYGLVQLDEFINIMRSVVAHGTSLPLLNVGVTELAGSAIVALGAVLIGRWISGSHPDGHS